MGVQCLWQVLPVRKYDHAQHAEVAKAVDGMVVAVDASILIMEARSQMHLASTFAPTTSVLKVALERTMNWLRYGVLPVLVLEGAGVEAKAGRLAQRYEARTGVTLAPSAFRPTSAANGGFAGDNRLLTRLMNALGVPVVQAPGEAEAMCAALNARGLADAVHSKDVDCLLFGAERALKRLHLQTDVSRNTEMVECKLEDIRSQLRIRRGGTKALRVASVLAGGDYNVDGAEKVGASNAMKAVAALLQGHEDDESIEDALLVALTERPDRHLLDLTHCTGCKTCGHESGNKSSCKQHSKKGCAACGTAGSGGGGCVPKPEGSPCQCEFHRTENQRLLARVLERAYRTEGFTRLCQAALAEYEQQTEAALAAAGRYTRQQQIRWLHRPDVQAVYALFTEICPELQWSYEVVRYKLRPLLLEWDLAQGPAKPTVVSAGALAGAGAEGTVLGAEAATGEGSSGAASAATARQSTQVEFRPVAIQKLHGQKGNSGPTDQCWRYVLTIQRVPGVGSAEAQRLDEGWLKGEQPVQQIRQPSLLLSQGTTGGAGLCSQVHGLGLGSGTQREATNGEGSEGEEGDEENEGGGTQQPLGTQGVRKAKGLAGAQQRAVRMSLVQRHWPHLVRGWEEKQRAAKAKKEAPKGRKGKGKVGTAAADAVPDFASQGPAPSNVMEALMQGAARAAAAGAAAGKAGSRGSKAPAGAGSKGKGSAAAAARAAAIGGAAAGNSAAQVPTQRPLKEFMKEVKASTAGGGSAALPSVAAATSKPAGKASQEDLHAPEVTAPAAAGYDRSRPASEGQETGDRSMLQYLKVGGPVVEENNSVLRRLAQARLERQQKALAAAGGGPATQATAATGSVPGESQSTQAAGSKAAPVTIDLTADTPPPKPLAARLQSRAGAPAAEQPQPVLHHQQGPRKQQQQVQGSKGGDVQAVIDLVSSDEEEDKEQLPITQVAAAGAAGRPGSSSHQQHRQGHPEQQQLQVSPSKRPASGPAKPGSPAKKALF